jgi:hypothetical protein
MPSLSRDLRRQLEKTIAGKNGARQIAEEGAEQSLQRLAVATPRAHDLLTEAEKTFRVDLRRHAQQRGDRLNERPTHLIQEIGYEHWHRMLFARFLAENYLLLHPEHGVALSLDEVKELALGLKRDWIEVAAEYAQRMLLREVFRPDDPSLRVPLPPEKRLELEGKLDSLPQEIFLADDSLGWVYQFWQRDAKDEVNRSEVKIGADELAPVTQLFTEDYMVLFLLENTLGAWWTAQRGAPDLPGYTWTYLRLNDDGSPSAGSFDTWPKSAKELKVLDPCMGSGHFLTFALPILARMRVAEEGCSLSEAIAAVLRDNLFGLELDPRCSQIAAFNLALTAWKLAGVHFELPPLNLACSGLGINAKEEDWIKLAGADGRKQDLMSWLYSLFHNAPTLGSLIDPRRVGQPMVEDEITELLPLLGHALGVGQQSEETRELAIAAQGLVAAAKILSADFTLLATNVPYLARAKQSSVLRRHCETSQTDARSDLATCFLDRAIRACVSGGSIALVTPQNWLFLKSYQSLRVRLLKNYQWDFVARLGPKAFQTPMWDFNVMLLGMTRRPSNDSHWFAGWDVGEVVSVKEKADHLRSADHMQLTQSRQLSNTDCRVTLTHVDHTSLLSEHVVCHQGLATGDLQRFGRRFWEISRLDHDWVPWQSTIAASAPYDGRSMALFWQNGIGELHRYNEENKLVRKGTHLRGSHVRGKSGVLVSQMGNLPATVYTGEHYDDNTTVLLPKNPEHLAAVWSFCSSPSYAASVRQHDNSLKVPANTLAKVPFDLEYWLAVAQERYPGGLPIPYSPDPSQWLFDGLPATSDCPLQVAVCRLLGYHWPRQTGSSFADCPGLQPDEIEPFSDEDGIVCLPSIAGEDPAAARVRALLKAALGAEYNLSQLLTGTKSSSLEIWMRDEFFAEHCRIFHDRPFVWHVWDGLKDGFHAFVNYHELDHQNLEKLIYSYLGDWLTRQRQDVGSGVEGSDTRLAGAEHLQGELKKILDGEAPYDVFVRWKPLKQQPIGWEPDLNDGVRMNIRPWITEARLYKATQPGILRITPNIKYTKDRGNEPARDPQDFPWFRGSTDRINDHHLSLEEKRRARGR